MKPLAQPDLHPDADLLNAFAEHALSEPERERIVAHMADCGRCRDIVYLAQSAAEPESAPAAIEKSYPRPGGLAAAFARWRVALIPAAALAAVGAIVLWVQLHPASRPVETAQLSSPQQQLAPALSAPSAPQAAAVKAVPAAAPRPPASTAAKPDQDAQSRKTEHKEIPSSEAATAAMFPLRNSDAVTTPAQSSPSAPNVPAGEIHLDGRSAAMARYTPPQPVNATPVFPYAPQQRPMMRVTPGPAAQAPANLAAPSSGNPPPVPPSPGLLAVHGEQVASPTEVPSQAALQSLQQVEVSPQTFDGLSALVLAKRAKLPSGLDTISSAALLNRLVAVDSAGAVFLSNDGGRHWAPVFAPWAGKAVEVQSPQGRYRLMPAADDRRRQMTAAASQASMNTAAEIESKEVASPPPTGASTTPASAAKAKAPAPTPATLFRLVTDRHEVWLSADGKVWREQ